MDVCPLSSDGELSVPESQILEGIIEPGTYFVVILDKPSTL